ncbi:hypothetical protein MtrunA17_Chr1g0155031 [Medicago truncatula]|uniref:Transmembrane protein n=1 Tax=Medicago truncatula TaxID=3880 RepID=A0A396JQU4_MEDTR|nr:hypothetical protein MtrunA17_Chr1g0155031 [Medicago truncatula]
MSGALAWQIRKKLIKLQLFCFEREERDWFGDSFFICPPSLSSSVVCVLPLASLFLFCCFSLLYYYARRVHYYKNFN